jgi:hypothetical protein
MGLYLYLEQWAVVFLSIFNSLKLLTALSRASLEEGTDL